MSCYHPLTAYKLFDGSVVFVERGDVVQTLSLPCGQCIGCRLERSRQWAIRCQHEASLYEDNCFITLTYNDFNLPDGGSLVYSDFQRFMKRLRKCYPLSKIRFYMCGEYGDDLSRPHYHACLFNFNFVDRVLHSKSSAGFNIYRSASLERLWPHGFSSIGDFTYETAAYTARYVMKKITGHRSDMHYENMDSDGVITRRVSEFNRMSLKPGIGATWYAKFHSDVHPHDHVIINGRPVLPPKYYGRLLQKDSPLDFEAMQFKRFEKFSPLGADNSPDRLAVKEQVTKARVKQLKRNTF